MTNSLAKRLTYRVMIVVMVMLVFITGIVYFSVRNYMLDEAQERYVGILQRRIQEAIGMSPVDYRLMLTRDL